MTELPETTFLHDLNHHFHSSFIIDEEEVAHPRFPFVVERWQMKTFEIDKLVAHLKYAPNAL